MSEGFLTVDSHNHKLNRPGSGLREDKRKINAITIFFRKLIASITSILVLSHNKLVLVRILKVMGKFKTRHFVKTREPQINYIDSS